MRRDKRPPMKHAERAGSLLQNMLNQSELGDQLSRHQAWLIWDKLVGKQIAMRARPLRIRKGILEVQVDHPVWMQQLQMLKPQILKRLEEMAPNAGISDIYLRQTSRASKTVAPAVKTQAELPGWLKEELSADDAKAIDAELRSITDPALKAEMRKVYMRHAQLRQFRNK